MTVLISSINGKSQISSDAAALLMGIPSNQVLVKVATGEEFPEDWLAAWRGRSAEARAATGRNDLLGVLDYWAAKDLGRNIVVLGAEVLL